MTEPMYQTKKYRKAGTLHANKANEHDAARYFGVKRDGSKRSLACTPHLQRRIACAERRSKTLIDWEYSMGREGSLLRCVLILCMLMMGIFLMYRMWHFFVCRRARCAAKRKWKHRARRRK